MQRLWSANCKFTFSSTGGLPGLFWWMFLYK
jgi:hypothetical protein